jgi:hypothetical protein
VEPIPVSQKKQKADWKIQSVYIEDLVPMNGACLFTVMLCNGDYFYPVVRQADE